MAITSAISDLIHSFYELLATIVTTITHTVSSFASAVLGLFTSFFQLLADVFSGAVQVAGGVANFVLGNILLIGLVAAGGYLYVRNQQKQGKTVKVGGKPVKA